MDNVKSFNVVLRSDAIESKRFFPDNKITKFKNRLPTSLKLSPEWRVALVDITFPNTLMTISRPEKVTVFIHGRKARNDTEDEIPDISDDIVVKPKCYESVSALVAELNSLIQTKLNEEIGVEDTTLPSISIDESTDVVTIHDGVIMGRRAVLKFLEPPEGQLGNILGINRWGQAFLNARHTNFYVYTDIVEPRIVGHTKVKLLQHVNVTAPEIPYGGQIPRTYKDPIFLPLSKNHIDEIEILILDDTGNQPNFYFGEICLTIMFRYESKSKTRIPLVMPSNASMDLYPDNKRSHFRVRLPHTLHLGKNYQVAMTDISFTKSWFNISGENYIRSPNLPFDLLAKREKVDDKKVDPRILIKPGYYPSPKRLIEEINKQIKEIWGVVLPESRAPDSNGLIPVFELDDISGYLKLKREGFFRDHYVDPKKKMELTTKIQIEFGEELGNILGVNKFDGTQEDLESKLKHPVNLNQGFTNLYVYSNITSPMIVGDVMAPLLRVINARPDAAFGTHVTEPFEKPYFNPISQNTIQDVEIYIKTDTGQAPYFNFGRTVVGLLIESTDEEENQQK